MKLIQPSVEFYGEVPTDYDSALKFIEKCGRLCYKSEGKITEDSAEKFVRKLIESGHLAMVEHSSFVVVRQLDRFTPFCSPQFKYLTTLNKGDKVWVGGNLTAWVQAALEEGPDPIFEPFCSVYGELFGHSLETGVLGYTDWKVCPHSEIPKELHRYSAKFVCNRAVSHELVRHRPCSFAQESQRYVRYESGDTEFIEPVGFFMWPVTARIGFYDMCDASEEAYGLLRKLELKPQQARAVLPNATKTEIIVTADAKEWSHIKVLRNASPADPEMVRVMNMMPWEEFL